MDQDWSSQYYQLDQQDWEYHYNHDALAESSVTLRPPVDQAMLGGTLAPGLMTSETTNPFTVSNISSRFSA